MIDYEEGSCNVYADLGMPDAEEMFLKAQLASKIDKIIKNRKWSRQQAAEVLEMTQPELNKMLCGQFREISQAKMLEYLAKVAIDAP